MCCAYEPFLFCSSIAHKEHTFTELKPATEYIICSFVLYDKVLPKGGRPPYRMSNESFEQTKLVCSTLTEDVCLEWERMTINMQENEVHCCFYDVYVRKAAEAAHVYFPDMEKPLNSMNAVAATTSAAATAKMEAYNKNHKLWVDFVAWWTKGPSGSNKARKEFLMRESIFGLLDIEVPEEKVSIGRVGASE